MHLTGSSSGNGGGVGVVSLGGKSPHGRQQGVAGFELLSYFAAVGLVQPEDFFVYLPEPPASYVGRDLPVPRYFLPYVPLGFLDPFERVEHLSFFPSYLVVVKKRASFFYDPVQFVEDVNLVFFGIQSP